ncbi:pentapeptide repeat-containing protein [Pseudanabaena galeata UHCC 0370]|uniref:Pentapeptide repeat-containing protein n=1 Tax=Pseudanabaena galeata UHCC 0370 TaxID=3110310 RepID=A0ABU5TLV3_9CYAN|nr:pentapeptide repeat-containing protein [Pseudanabaena galeata]MEA5479240.1 pentapeptide repeat-containing protein [Pseudanabaena galeata UHCC 0370]
MNIQESLKLHGRWLKTNGKKGARLIAKGADLSEANLMRYKLSEADLSGADLSKAKLFEAKLIGADLHGANLSGADLHRAKLISADLSRAVLSGAVLEAADLSKAKLIEAKLIEADLYRADLGKADLGKANLSGANLSEAYLSEAYLRGINLSGANLSGANLSGANLSGIDLRGINLRGINLSGANLSGANLSGIDLSGIDLSGANLSGANLIEANALKANFTFAVLTGACIEDWHINTETVLEDIQCEYIYLKQDSNGKYVDRRPSNEEAVFVTDDFAKLVRKAQSTVDLIFRNGIDWKALAISFDKFKIESDGVELTVRAIENKDDGDFVIKVDVPADANKSEIEKFLKQEYESAIKAIDARYQERLSLKDEQAKFYLEQVSYERQEKTRLIEVVKIMAEQESSKYDLRGANIGNFADTVRDNARQQANQYNYTPEQKLNLADAASEIQQLLEQLSATYPTTTIAEKTAVATKAVEAIEKNPNQKAKIVKAVKAGGIAALKELVSPVVQPVTNILFPILEALAADE